MQHLDDSGCRSLLDTLDTAVSVVESVRDEGGAIVDFRTIYVNDRAAELTGVPVAEQIGKRWSELAPTLLEGDLFRDWVNVVNSGDPAHQTLALDLTVLGKYEVTSTYELSARKWRDGVVATYRDVSDRLALEEQRKASARAEDFNRKVIGGLVDAQRRLDDRDYSGAERAMRDTFAAASEIVRHMAPMRVS